MNYLKYLNVPNKSNANTQHHQSQRRQNLQVFFRVAELCVACHKNFPTEDNIFFLFIRKQQKFVLPLWLSK